MRARIIIVVALLAGAFAPAEDVRVSAVLERPELPFHHTARYTLIAEAPEQLTVSFPDLPKIAAVETRAQEPVREVLEGGRQRVRKTWVLDPINVGDYIIPPLDVTIGESQKAGVPAIALTVRDLTEEEEEAALGAFAHSALPDSFLPGPPRGWGDWISIVAAALIAVAIGLAIFTVWRRKISRPLPPPTPWEVARQRLRALAARQLPQQGQIERYYIDLSAIFRYYIEDRFRLRAPEETTPEFLEEATKSGQFTPGQQDALARFLHHCDLVKFALYQPTAEQIESSFSLVTQFIEETVPAGDPAPKQIQEAAA